MPQASMYAQLKQFGRAAHLLKLHLLLCENSFCAAAKLADIYFQEWLQSGGHFMCFASES